MSIDAAKCSKFGWQYSFYNNVECFAVWGPGIDAMSGNSTLLKFASPALAEQMCAVLQAAYQAGARAVKDEIRKAMNSET